MKVVETFLKGCYIIEPVVFEDSRGYFFESFNAEKFEEATGLAPVFVQDNQSASKRGVLRGIHYQTGDWAQTKLVRVLSGKIIDVAVDLRPDSETFGTHFSIELSADNRKQLYIPKGFGHGFIVLSEMAEVLYKCDNFYNKESEGGIIYNDPFLGINWMLNEEELIVSEKDIKLPTFENAKM